MVRCMASKRQNQVGEIVKRNFSSVLMEQGSYIYGDAIVSVTNVQMSSDLRLAKVYLSIFSQDDKEEIYQKILEASSSLKYHLVKRIRRHVRSIPEIDIYLDDLLDEMYRINNMLDDLQS